MAIVTKAHGTTVAPSTQLGRDLVWIGIAVSGGATTDMNDAYAGSSTYLDQVRQIVDQAASITIIGGMPTGAAVMFGVEGAGFAGAVEGPAWQLQINEIRDQVEAFDGGALGTAVCTIQDIEEGAFNVLFTDA